MKEGEEVPLIPVAPLRNSQEVLQEAKEQEKFEYLTKLWLWQQVVLAVFDPRLHGILSGSLTTKVLCELLLPLWIHVDIKDEVLTFLNSEDNL